MVEPDDLDGDWRQQHVEAAAVEAEDECEQDAAVERASCNAKLKLVFFLSKAPYHIFS